MKKIFLILLCLITLLSCLTACDSDSIPSNSSVVETNDGMSQDNAGLDLVDVPTEEYIVACLKNTPNVIGVAAVTEDNDPNGMLNADDGYYSAVFFAVDLIDQDEVYGDDLIGKGNDAGGCIEAYKSVAEAEARNEYLAEYDDNWLLNAGYHTVIGTLVVRTSSKLSEDEQRLLENNIIDVFTSGEIDVPAPTDPSESEDESSDKPESAESKVDTSDEKIIMPKSASDYIGAEWTIDSLTKHFNEMGFTNIRAIPCEPDDDNYDANIFELSIRTGWFSTDPWEAGDEFNSDAEISIYYNEFPLLTVENCPDLVTILTSQDVSYTTFAEEYDGRYIQFDGYVTYHITYNAGIDHIIQVTGGDYDGSTELGNSEDGYYDGLNIRIGDRMMENSINESVEEGDLVTVCGKIDADWSEYYGNLYVETIYLERR